MKTPLALTVLLTVLRSVHTVRAFTLLFLGATLLPATGVAASLPPDVDLISTLPSEMKKPAQEAIDQAGKDFAFIVNSIRHFDDEAELEDALLRTQQRVIDYLKSPTPVLALLHLKTLHLEASKLSQAERRKLVEKISQLEVAQRWPILATAEELSKTEIQKVAKLSFIPKYEHLLKAYWLTTFLFILFYLPPAYSPVGMFMFAALIETHLEARENPQLIEGLNQIIQPRVEFFEKYGQNPLRKILCEMTFDPRLP